MSKDEKTPAKLRWARQLFSLSQAGLTYSKIEYDLERYHQIQDLAAEMLVSSEDIDKDAVLHSFSLQKGYPTPKIDVRGAVIWDGKVLLVQESADQRWSMPGGWADIGDLPSQTAEREVLEESGYRVRTDKVIAVYDANHLEPFEFFHAYKLIFQCKLIGGEVKTSNETLAVGFFSLEDLPPLSNFRTNRLMIEEAFAHARNPFRRTAFD